VPDVWGRPVKAEWGSTEPGDDCSEGVGFTEATETSRDMNVLLLLRSRSAPAWTVELANVLMETSGFQVSALLVPPDSPGIQPVRRRAGAKQTDTAGSSRRSPKPAPTDPFASVDVTHALPALRVDESGAFATGLDRTSIDVALAADFTVARGFRRLANLNPRLGFWYSPALCGDERGRMHTAIGAIRPQTPGSFMASVYSVDAGTGVEQLVKAAIVGRESLFAARNRRDAGWGAASLVFAALEQASRDPSSALRTWPIESDRACDLSPLPISGPPQESTCVRRENGQSTFARFATTAYRRAVLRPQWVLAYQFGGGAGFAPTKRTRFAVPPSDRFWADPHVVQVDGAYHVFFEEYFYRTGKACISTMRLGEDGPIGESRAVLEAEHHLSFPFVFSFDGGWFMIPESSQARRIDIYRAEEFPSRWTLFRTLMDNVHALDTTMIEHDGRWWLFVTLGKLSGVSSVCHLYMFSADSPLSETWEPHPCNPIASGAAGARAAGGILRCGDGLMRPSQDSCLAYGHRIQLNKIETLTQYEYRECLAGYLEPNRASGFDRLHTVSRAGDLTVLDLCRWRSRL
jgi:hypothetical protein